MSFTFADVLYNRLVEYNLYLLKRDKVAAALVFKATLKEIKHCFSSLKQMAQTAMCLPKKLVASSKM